MGTYTKTRKNTQQRGTKEKYRKRNQSKQEKTTKFRKPVNGFLKSSFNPIPANIANPLFTECSYRYIYNSAKNYASLLGKNFLLNYEPTDFEVVCDKLDALLPKELSVRLTTKNEKLHLKIVNDIAEYTLYYIPCKIIDEAEGVYKKILLEFFRIFHYKQEIKPLKNTYFLEAIINDVDNCQGGDLDSDWLKLIKSYTTGEISKTLKAVNSKPGLNIEELKALIKSYKPRTKDEKIILSLIRKGLKLLQSGKVYLHFTNKPRPDLEENAIPADHLLLIIYDDKDMITEYLEQYVNESAYEQSAELFSSINKIISPKMKTLPKPDKFVVNFDKWLLDFSYVLYNR